MASFKKLPKKPKKPNLSKASLPTLKGYEKKVADWKKVGAAVKKYNADLKKAREKVKSL